jgi:hypothetical protein
MTAAALGPADEIDGGWEELGTELRVALLLLS